MQDGDAVIPRQPGQQGRDLLRASNVEVGKRLVEQEEPRPPTSAWAISTRCCSPPDSSPPGRQRSERVDRLEHPSTRARRRLRRQRHPEAVAVDPERDDVAGRSGTSGSKSTFCGTYPIDRRRRGRRLAVETDRARSSAPAVRESPARSSSCRRRSSRSTRRTHPRRREVDVVEHLAARRAGRVTPSKARTSSGPVGHSFGDDAFRGRGRLSALTSATIQD